MFVLSGRCAASGGGEMTWSALAYVCGVLENWKFEKISPIHKIKDGSCVVMTCNNKAYLITIREVRSEVTVPDFLKFAQSILN